MGRFEIHSHSCYSNLRIIDSINTIKGLFDRAMKLGLSGICLTDHECLSGHVEVDKIQKELSDSGSSFKFARGNEIYLVDERGQDKHYHFILIAKDAIGHKQLRELTSIAWENSYFAKGVERVDTLKTDLYRVVKSNPGHLIASTACLGGELDCLILEMERSKDRDERKAAYKRMRSFVGYCLDLFGDDFYFEVQPARSEDQMVVNRKIHEIADYFGVKLVVSTDAHYLSKDERSVHKAYLNSKQGDREVDTFYEYAYLQSTEDVIENLDGTGLDYQELEDNTNEIYSKIENYCLFHTQQVPRVKVIDYPKKTMDTGRGTLNRLFVSDDEQERYWVNQCYDKLSDLGLLTDEYLDRLEYEASVKETVSKRLDTCMFAYPVFLQHYIDLFWECGSPVCAGRGSAGAGLNHWLLGVTQVDPIKSGLDCFWRYMNHDTKELGDIDIDLAPSKREKIFDRIREERGKHGCVQICTFGTEGTKAAILSAARGYRSEQYPNGIDVDTAKYLSSLIESERGFVYSISDTINGNADKGRKPNKTFVNEVSKYPGLLEIIERIEGLVKSRGIHASGVCFYDENDPYATNCFMKAGNGSIITQFSLHDSEYLGDTKLDFLVTEQMDIMAQCIDILQENGYIEKELTLREAYDKYVTPEKIPLDDPVIWDTIDNADMLALFQFTSTTGTNIVKKLRPRNVNELTACNALTRLMPEDMNETPSDRYYRFKNDISQWYKEMDEFGLSKDEQRVLEKHCLDDYGVPSSQEAAMLLFMDEDVCGFSLAEANDARRVISKKKMDKIPELREKVISSAKSKKLGEYVWNKIIALQMG